MFNIVGDADPRHDLPGAPKLDPVDAGLPRPIAGLPAAAVLALL